MHYYLCETALDGSVYSCDKICITGKIGHHFSDTFSSELSKFLICSEVGQGVNFSQLPFGFKGLKQYIYYEKFGVRFFRNNFNLLLSDDTSFYFGYDHNSQIHNKNQCTWKIELNPNKCLPCEFTSRFVSFVISRSKPSSVIINQVDIAIDITEDRFNVYLEKDSRKYTKIDSGGDNYTEYLSSHNENGFVKVYNKTKEGNLDYTLTRIEVTIKDLSFTNFKNVFPKVHIYKTQMEFTDNSFSVLSQNDQIFLTLLRMHPEFLKKLTYRKQVTFKPFVYDDAPLLQPDVNAFVNLIEKIRNDFFVSK